ncbi:riboflavin synthase [Granulosicoccus sp. 3-233]|uniref:riboflavin synthase n=1 Tax=Granulosicoccus sp. 3-233 TaxID=3417969 RepID=UPI003D348201
MFTGIVEELGTVRDCRRSGDGYALSIDCATVLEGTALGDSIAVNGVCLTVTELDANGFVTGLAPETRKRTNLDSLVHGSKVNLERSVTPTTRMGGHFVQGHVDATGTIRKFRRDEDALWVTIAAPAELMRYIVTKGYITLDGTSLTVVDVGDDWFSVTLVAYTQAHIVMPGKSVGDGVNIEVDVLGKYVERLIQQGVAVAHSGSTTGSGAPASAITPEFLRENGYD